MKLPSPYEELGGCVWLPRILAKARLLRQGALPPEYASRLCHPTGVDGHFLAHFGLTREDVLAASALPEAEAASWLVGRTTAEWIREWNHLAVNLGRAGFPMAERFPVALSTIYQHLAGRGLTSVFEVLEADEEGA